MFFILKDLVMFPFRFPLIQRDLRCKEVLVPYLLVERKFLTVPRRPWPPLLRLKYFVTNPIALPA